MAGGRRLRRLALASGLAAVLVLAMLCIGDRLIERYAVAATLAPEDAAWLRSPAARQMVAAAFADLDGAPVVDHDVALISVGGQLPGAPANDSRRLAPTGPLARLDRELVDRAARIGGPPNGAGRLEARYVSYLLRQIRAMPGAYRGVIAGRDAAYDSTGHRLTKANGQIIDNAYVAWLAAQRPRALAAAVSVHPGAPRAAQRLARWAGHGIHRLAWWPGPQHIDPAGAAVRAITPVLAETGMRVSLTVGAVTDRLGMRAWIAPASVATLLDSDVPVELRLGESLGPAGQALLPELIALLRQYRGRTDLTINLGGLIATGEGRDLFVGLLQHPQFYDHLVYGSGYPESIVAERVRLDALVDRGLIDSADRAPLADIRATNPLLFVYVLHRQLRLPETDLRLPAAVFTAGS